MKSPSVTSRPAEALPKWLLRTGFLRPTAGPEGWGGGEVRGGRGLRGGCAESVLQLCGKVSIDGRLARGVTAGRLGTRLFGLFDAEDAVQELVGVGRTGVLGDEQQDAPVGCLEDAQEPPFAVEAQPADA